MTEGADNIVAFVLSALNCVAAYFIGKSNGIATERMKNERIIYGLIRDVNKFLEGRDAKRQDQ